MFSIDSGKMNFTFEPPVFPSCKTIDIEQYLYYDFQKISPRQITFDFFKINNIGLYLYIEDKTKALKRPLKSSKLSYLGPSISNSNLDAPTKQNFVIRTEFNLKTPYGQVSVKLPSSCHLGQLGQLGHLGHLCRSSSSPSHDVAK